MERPDPFVPRCDPETPAIDTLRLISLNHQVASLEVLDRAALGPNQVRALTARLKASGIATVVVSTCNRFEVYWRSRHHDDDAVVERALGEFRGDPALDWSAHALRRSGAEAARHLLRVAAGLNSLIVGESEILGQIRAALRTAQAESSLDEVMEQLFRSALRFGGQARAATGIGAGAMSTVSAALQAMRSTTPDFRGLTAVVLGAGQTGYKAAQLLRSAGIGRLIVVNRTAARARELAEALQAEWAPVDDFDPALDRADVLFVAIQVPAPFVTTARVRATLRQRPRPLTIVDLSMPRAVSPEVTELAEVGLIDFSRLEEVVGRSRCAREREIPRVEALLGPAMEELESDIAEVAARPLVAELRIRAERIRRAEVERAVAAGIVDPDALEHVTRRIVDRLLSTPSAALREGHRPARERSATCLDCVFGVAPGGTRATP